MGSHSAQVPCSVVAADCALESLTTDKIQDKFGRVHGRNMSSESSTSKGGDLFIVWSTYRELKIFGSSPTRQILFKI